MSVGDPAAKRQFPFGPPVAVDTFGAMGKSTIQCFNDLGRRLVVRFMDQFIDRFMDSGSTRERFAVKESVLGYSQR